MSGKLLFVTVVAARGKDAEISQSEFPDHVAAFHGVVFLGRRQGRLPPGRGDLEAGRNVRRTGGPQDVGVVADVLADPAAGGPAVAEGHGDRVVGLPGKDHGHDLQAPAALVQANQVAVGDAQLTGRRRAQQGCVPPGQLGDRVGQLLKPAVVRVPAVVQLGVPFQDQLEVRGREWRRCRTVSGHGPCHGVTVQRRFLDRIAPHG